MRVAVDVFVFVFMFVFGAEMHHKQILMVLLCLRGVWAAPVLFSCHS